MTQIFVILIRETLNFTPWASSFCHSKFSVSTVLYKIANLFTGSDDLKVVIANLFTGSADLKVVN